MLTISHRINTLLLLVIILMAGAIITMLATRAYGGPLDPPGPVASTQSNLIYQPATCAGFPIVLSTAGSYRLGSSISGCAAKDGIQIASSNVTLDLAGFTLFGVPGSLDGISSNGPRYATVINGLVRGWSNGINLVGTYSHVERVNATNNVNAGIIVGAGSEVSDCVVSLNGGPGIDVNYATVRTCTVAENQTGIRAQNYSLIEGNRANANGLWGIEVAGNYSTVRNNETTSNNFDLRISSGTGNVIKENGFCLLFDSGTATVMTNNDWHGSSC